MCTPLRAVLLFLLFTACRHSAVQPKDDADPTSRPEATTTGIDAGEVDAGAANSGRFDLILPPRGMTSAELPDPGSPGALLVDRFCSQCHAIPPPSSHAAEDWVAVFRNMVLRMDRAQMRERMGRGMMGRGMMGRGMMGRGMMGRGPIVAPSRAQQRTIREYLQAHAMKTVPRKRLPGGEGERLFEQECSRCHALPAPTQHPAAQWPSVVERMRQHMRQVGISDLTASQAKQVDAYLARASNALQGP